MNYFRDKANSSPEISQFYKSSEGYNEMLLRHDAGYFDVYVRKVVRFVPQGSRLLDLGCGTGLSSRLLADRGYRVVGADLSEKFLDKNYCQDDLELVAADAGALPFPDRSFDAVASYCFLEHVPDAPKVLAEMARVLRPGGVVLVLSPNLVSPFLVLKSLVNLLRGRVISGVIAPTIFGHLSALVRFIVISIRKGKSGDPMFLYRVPDLEHPSLADADSVYLCNQLDLIRYYSKAGLRSVNAGEGYSSIGKVIAKLFPNCSGECCVVATRLA